MYASSLQQSSNKNQEMQIAKVTYETYLKIGLFHFSRIECAKKIPIALFRNNYWQFL